LHPVLLLLLRVLLRVLAGVAGNGKLATVNQLQHTRSMQHVQAAGATSLQGSTLLVSQCLQLCSLTGGDRKLNPNTLNLHKQQFFPGTAVQAGVTHTRDQAGSYVPMPLLLVLAQCIDGSYTCSLVVTRPTH
jgi:hypothetical protein